MNSFSFFNPSSSNPGSIFSTSNNDLFPSKVIAPTFPNQPLPNIAAPVLVFPEVSQFRF